MKTTRWRAVMPSVPISATNKPKPLSFLGLDLRAPVVARIERDRRLSEVETQRATGRNLGDRTIHAPGNKLSPTTILPT